MQRFPATDATGVTVEILSALAEGADRWFVEEAAALEGAAVELHAVLPMPAAEYMSDFDSPASRDEFEQRLAQARHRTVMPPAPTRERAYELAGRYIVDNSDALIAVWDGDPRGGQGGTAQIVEYARSRNVSVLVVPAARASHPDQAPAPADGPEFDAGSLRSAQEAYARTDEFNRRSISEPVLAGQLASERTRLLSATDNSAIAAELETIAAWTLPRYVRADALAMRYQRLHNGLGAALYLTAALAVTAVAAQALASWNRRLALMETAFMLILLAIYVITRRVDLHERWLGYRSMAEAFRSGLFIAMVTTDDPDQRDPPATLESQPQPWFQRVFSEAWPDRPEVTPDPAMAEDLRAFLVRAWIEDQLHYHARAGVRMRGERRRLNSTVFALFTLTVVVGLVHVFDVLGDAVPVNLLVFLAVTMPAFGAALTGIRDQHQYVVHEERSRRTASRLDALRRRAPEPGFGAVQQLAADVQAAVEAERTDWWTVSEFQRVEMLI
jgi:hypothetical protein